MTANATRFVLAALGVIGLGMGLLGAESAQAKNPYPNPSPPPYLITLSPAVASGESQATVTLHWFTADYQFPGRVVESHLPADDQVQQVIVSAQYGQATVTVYCNEPNKFEMVDANFNQIVPPLMVQVQDCPLHLSPGEAVGLACAVTGNCDPKPAPPQGRGSAG
jgi:hypothetical protein